MLILEISVLENTKEMNPANYRPVSLTSHIMKILERVIKMPIIKHLESRGLVRPNQHGFVSGNSTQTQLLQHYSDSYEALEEGVRVDTVYLDYAKALIRSITTYF